MKMRVISDRILIAVALLAAGVIPVAAQTAGEQRARAVLVPAQTSTSPPNGLGMRGPRLAVPNVIVAEPASEVRLAIDLEPADSAPRGSFVRVRGLPPTAALSDGHAIAPGAWAVPTAALKNLRIIVPAGSTGRSEISVSLVTLDGATIAEAKGSLLVAAARLIAPNEAPPAELPKEQPTSRSFVPSEQGPVATAAPTSPPPALPAPANQEQQAARPPVTPNEPAATPPPLAPAAPKAAPPAPAAAPKAPDAMPEPTPAPANELAAAARQKAENLMSRGRAMLNEGNIAAARLFFERSADEGLAEGALAMGTTFDPAELQRMRALTRPDVSAARRWYERAKSLGNREADAKLQALPAR